MGPVVVIVTDVLVTLVQEINDRQVELKQYAINGATCPWNKRKVGSACVLICTSLNIPCPSQTVEWGYVGYRATGQ